MAEWAPSKPLMPCRSRGKRAALKCGLDRFKRALMSLETLFGEFASKDPVVGDYPVPTSPPRTPTPAAYPEPATLPGWRTRTPVGQHDHEATGSNHTSNHTSEYFDASDPSQLENLLQHRIGDAEFDGARLRNRIQYGSEQGYEHAQQGIEYPQSGFSLGGDLSQFGNCECPHMGTDHSQNGFGHLQQRFDRPHFGLEDQLAGSIGNMLLSTPTGSQASHPGHPHPWDDHPFLNPVAPVSEHHHHDPPVHEYYYSGELNPSWFQPADATGSQATSTAPQQQQQQKTTTTTTMTPTGYGGMSVRTGETGDSRESLMDTAGTSTASPYILGPVDEEKPSILPRTFNRIYVELRRFVRGDEVAFPSARMGRTLRVLGRAFCYTRRLRKMVMRVRLAKSHRKRKRSESLRPKKPRQQCTKKMRSGGVVPTQPMTPGVSTQSTTEGRYKGVAFRNGHWVAEMRVSACEAYPKAKVWIGTFSSAKEAALASDAGYYHCTEKYNKKFNFPQFVNQLGDSQYQTVLAFYNTGRKEEAKELVKTLAATHAKTFRAP